MVYFLFRNSQNSSQNSSKTLGNRYFSFGNLQEFSKWPPKVVFFLTVACFFVFLHGCVLDMAVEWIIQHKSYKLSIQLLYLIGNTMTTYLNRCFSINIFVNNVQTSNNFVFIELLIRKNDSSSI